MYYNIKIKSNGGEYCLECKDKDITQREMDIYFANLFGASKEFIDKIKKIDRKNTIVKSIDDFTIETFVRNEDEDKKETNSHKQNDEFVQIVNPKESLQKDTLSNESEKKEISLSPLTFKPLPQEELVFQNNTPKEIESPKEETNKTSSIDADLKVEKEALKIDDKPSSNDDFTLIEEDEEEPETSSNDELTTFKDDEKNTKINEKSSSNNDFTLVEEDKEENPEITSIKEEPLQNETQETNLSKTNDFEIVGLNDDKEKEQKEKEKKQNILNKTIELVQDAVKNIDIASDETFDVDIPDTYSKTNIESEITLSDEDFDKEEQEENMNETSSTIQNISPIEIQKEDNEDSELILLDDEEDEEEQIINQENNSEINSIFSNESPFENPPESQNIIAAKEYPEKKKALNLDFKTFLSNYETNGIIDEFLICAYYIKHISGQHSFNMKYINSKLFQATGKIADLSIVNGLVNGDFIKVFEVDGAKKYSITSTGEEYFMTHYQR